ncbi:MAG: peptidylprolyl isomerase [Verrucomicrobia bacterium]|nr:peptidylprolyl isomerase [Verrucomicrobiota bacterium]
MKTKAIQHFIVLAIVVAGVSCGQKPKAAATGTAAAAVAGAVPAGTLMRVGSITVCQADLDLQLQEKHAGRSDDGARQQALDELAVTAQFTQAALDEGLDHDPVVRAEIARILSNRLREKALFASHQALSAAVPESRLRELYAAGESRFRANEKRQVAVLWLNPNGDPQRAKQYADKLAVARDWVCKTATLKADPAQGFAVLGVDYSEHQASRYKGGVVGWLERDGGMDPWSKAVAELAFSLEAPGDVSAVTVRPEGVFLVRYMAQQAAVVRPFEAVSDELARIERQRLLAAAETEFARTLEAKYPVQLRSPSTLPDPTPPKPDHVASNATP